MIKGILFDFDGTIVDSEISRFKSTQILLEKEGIKLTKEMWDKKFKSMGSIVIFDFFKEKYQKKWNSKLLYEQAHKIRKKIEKKEGVVLIKGFLKFYEELKRRSIKIIICSGGTTKHLKFILNILNLNDLKGFGREEYKKRKPASDAYIEGLRRIGLRKEEVIVFEDARSGIEAAKAVKIEVVAINYSKEEIKDLNIKFKFNDYTKINFDKLLK